jgi:hypothetical protein
MYPADLERERLRDPHDFQSLWFELSHHPEPVDDSLGNPMLCDCDNDDEEKAATIAYHVWEFSCTKWERRLHNS